MNNNNSILIVGSVAMDSIETPFGKRESILGGSATYSSISASFFSKYINIVSVVGKDFPKKYIGLFRSRKINIDGLQIREGQTFRWKGDYNYDLNLPKTIYTYLNVFGSFKPVIPDYYKGSKYIFLANIDPDLQKEVLSQIKRPEIIICDTMNYWIDKKRGPILKLVKNIDIFLVNESEARQLSGETNMKKAANFIMSHGAPCVVIKKGEHGVLFFSKRFCFYAPAYLLETIKDPTGAGDAFAGGMIGYLSSVKIINKEHIRKSMIYGSIMASFTVEDFSVKRLLKLSMRDINTRYNEFKRITSF